MQTLGYHGKYLPEYVITDNIFNTRNRKSLGKFGVHFELRQSTCLHMMSPNEQGLMSGIITSLHSKYMTSSFHGRQITSWRESVLNIALTDYGFSWQIMFQICDKYLYFMN